MSNRREDVVRQAVEVLDRYGLADLSMRRLGAELGVQASAIYHHFASKQVLLGAVADEILRRGRRAPRPAAWDERATLICTELRDAVLAYRDGAELVATAQSFGLGAGRPAEELRSALADEDFDPGLVSTGARTLLHYVLGHALDEQTQLQAGSAGAIDDAPRESSDFTLGLELILDGLRLRTGTPSGPDEGVLPAPGAGETPSSRALGRI